MKSTIRKLVFVLVTTFSLALSSVQAESKVFGAYFCLSGPCAADGVDALQGVRIGVSEINLNGGLLGKTIKLEIADSNVVKDIEAAKKELGKLGAQIIFGVFESQQKLAVNLKTNLLVDTGRNLQANVPVSRAEFDFVFRKYYEQEPESYAYNSYSAVYLVRDAILASKSFEPESLTRVLARPKS